MAKNQNTFEKRRREVEKKFKAAEKRKERERRKAADSGPLGDGPLGAERRDEQPTEPQ